jgi:hypothetical protein
VNCDVTLRLDSVEQGIAFMEEHPDVGFVGGEIVPISGPKLLRAWRLQYVETKVRRQRPPGPTQERWLVDHALLVRRVVSML